MSNEMKTGEMPSTSVDMNVNEHLKTSQLVDHMDVDTQSIAKSRGGYMDLEPGAVNPMDSSC